MKTKAILFISLFVFLTSFNQAFAQLKIGHINTDKLIVSMPESDSVNATLEALNAEYTKVGEELQVDYNVANDEFQKGQATWSELVRQTKAAEMDDMMNRIQQFVANSRQDLQNKQQELFQPVLNKAQNAIQEVADEQGYDYVLETSRGAVLTVPKDELLDILKLVQEKLGIITQ